MTAKTSSAWAVAFGLMLAGPVVAQDEVFEHVSLRVSSVRPNGIVVVDRGKRDMVRAGDKVVLVPRNGAVIHGTVREVQDRSATVELVNRNDVVTPGVKGEVLIPRARRAAKPAPKPDPTKPDPTKPDPNKPDPNKPADEWKPGMPLLAGGRPLRPSERTSRATGRAYSAIDVTRTLDTFNNSYARFGTDFEVENPSGRGGTLRVHTEFDWLTETTEKNGNDLRVYDLSYSIGGTRYDPTRLTFGRFLSVDMPEFGLVDGVEWSSRNEAGHRFGASFGFLPELDEDLDSASDMQVAAWYLWPDTVAERVTWGFGYQKTWHHLRPDRDLLVGKVRYLPLNGWDLAATSWVDVYYGADQKRDGPELTRVRAHASRRWDGGGGLTFAYDHEEYPYQRRNETTQTIAPATILNAHQDMLSMHAYADTETARFFTRVSGWTDEADSGGTAEAGFLIDDLVQSGARSGLAGFVVQGATTTMIGGRIDHGGNLDAGRFDVLGEISFVHHSGFNNNIDDLLQYRLGGTWTSDLGDNWNLIAYGDGTLWDSELSAAAGFYLQRIF